MLASNTPTKGAAAPRPHDSLYCCIRFRRPKTSGPMRKPSSAETAGEMSISNTSLHFKFHFERAALLAVLNIVTTWTSLDMVAKIRQSR